MILPMACPEILACVQLASMVVAARPALANIFAYAPCGRVAGGHVRGGSWRTFQVVYSPAAHFLTSHLVLLLFD
jgi:hypothetical protein